MEVYCEKCSLAIPYTDDYVKNGKVQCYNCLGWIKIKIKKQDKESE